MKLTWLLFVDEYRQHKPYGSIIPIITRIRISPGSWSSYAIDPHLTKEIKLRYFALLVNFKGMLNDNTRNKYYSFYV